MASSHHGNKREEAMRDLIAELHAMHSPYTVGRFISSGSYGAVCAGVDGDGRSVAIKRVYNTVSENRVVNILSDSFLCKRVLREVRLLNHFHHHNILGLRDIFVHLQEPQQHKLYLVTELMRTDLGQVIRDQRIALSPQHIQFFMYHILLGLHVLHEAGVVHRDLHPGNVLLAENNDITICDFNLAREDTADANKTHYVTHRWYRAPELVMQYKASCKAVDLWSAGCVMAELFNRKPLFRGTTFYNQLNKIVEIVGTPDMDEIVAFSSASAREYLRSSLSNMPAQRWSDIVPSADALALDLLARLLQFNPAKRLHTEGALRHPYFAALFDPLDLTENLSTPFHFDESVSDVRQMHQMFRDEVARFNALREKRQLASRERGASAAASATPTNDYAATSPLAAPSSSSAAAAAAAGATMAMSGSHSSSGSSSSNNATTTTCSGSASSGTSNHGGGGGSNSGHDEGLLRQDHLPRTHSLMEVAGSVARHV